MSWKRYQNELMVLAALLAALGAFSYKHVQRTSKASMNQQMAKEVVQLQETVSLKRIWADKRIPKSLAHLRTLVPAGKVTWQKRGKRLRARFRDLSSSEVNQLVTKFLNVAVQVESLDIRKTGKSYTMEITCKW